MFWNEKDYWKWQLFPFARSQNIMYVSLNLHYYSLKKTPNTLKYQVALVSIYSISSTCCNETDTQYLNLCTQSSCFFFISNQTGQGILYLKKNPPKQIKSCIPWIVLFWMVFMLIEIEIIILLDIGWKKKRFRTNYLFTGIVFFVYLQNEQISFSLRLLKFAFYFPHLFFACYIT